MKLHSTLVQNCVKYDVDRVRVAHSGLCLQFGGKVRTQFKLEYT